MNTEVMMSGFIELAEKLDVGLDKPVNDAIFEVSGNMESKATESLDARIYKGNPETPNYKRTGAALGGHIVGDIGPGQRKVIFDSLLKTRATKGQAARDINHTPFLNRNSRIKKLNTHFWDDAVKETQDTANDILQKHIEPYL